MPDYIPTVVRMPFADGARDVSEHIAALLKGRKIPTYAMTYTQAIEALNWANATDYLNSAAARIQTDHLRRFG